MADKRHLSLEDYLTLVTKSSGGPRLALATLARRATARRGALEGLDHDSTRLASATAATESVEMGRDLSMPERSSLEAIIDEDIRPAIDIVDGTFVATHPLWSQLSSDAVLRTRIESVLPSVGRVELPGHPRLPYGGTGFVVGDGIIMTNRHVAEVFAAGLGDRRIAFLPNARAGIDFRREFERPTGPTLTVSDVLMIHPYWDMALLKVSGLTQTPLTLSLQDARDLTGRQIFVVGYPAFDIRNPARVQNDLFDRHFGTKRLQPGELQGGVETASFAKLVQAAGHDCSTLGGNSGSAVFDLQTGEVLGLHFGGAYHQVNYAVPASALSRDSRVVQAGVKFSGPAPGDPNTWGEWWTRADSQEQPSRTPETQGAGGTRPPASPPALSIGSPSANAGGAGETTFEIPLRITVSLGPVRGTGSMQARAVGGLPDVTEAMREPEHDTDYATRRGYDAAFLGEQGSLTVALPKPTKMNVVAPTLDGKRILHYQNFSVAMHAARRLALYTASNVTKETALRKPDAHADYSRRGLSGLGENDMEKWFIDPRMDERYQIPNVFFDKDRKAFDKGHIVRREDVAWGTSYELLRIANGDTYHVTNCSPQVAGFNRSNLGDANWGDLENAVLASAASERLCLFAGPVLTASDQVFVGVADRGMPLRIKVPSRFWKVIVSRTEVGLAAFGFVLEQDLSDVQWEFVVPDEFTASLYPLSDIEAMAGVTFPKAVRDADQYDTVRGAEMVMQGIARKGEE